MFWKGHHQAAVIMLISVTLKVSIKVGKWGIISLPHYDAFEVWNMKAEA